MRKTEKYQDDIIEQIRDFYKHHEEPYVAGSWESFRQYESQRRTVVTFPWRRLIVAAAISGLLCMGAWGGYQLSKRSTSGSQLAMTPPSTETAQPLPAENLQKIDEDSDALTVNTATPVGRKTAPLPSLAPPSNALPKATGENKPHVAYADLQAPEAKALTNRLQVPIRLDERIEQPPSQLTLIEQLPPPTLAILDREITLPSTNVNQKTEIGSAWRFGVELHSAVSDERLHFGGGMIAAYVLTDRLSLNSGISYLNLSGGYSLEEPLRMNSSTSLLSVESRLAAIDIPLSLTYHYGSRSQVSAGVSLLNVVSEQLDHHYAVNYVKTSLSTDMMTGETKEVRSTVTDYSTQEVDAQLLLGNTYLGFANLSWGREIGAFSRSRVLLAPYVKLPIGKLSKEEINLINVGVKLKLDF